MKIIDGIAYGEQEYIEVVELKPLPDYKLWVKFNNGEKRIYDFSDLLDSPAFLPLKDKTKFDQVYILYGAPAWENGEIDFDPECIYKNGEVA